MGQSPAKLRTSLTTTSRDHNFQSQTRYNDMTAALRKQLAWCTTGMNINPLEYVNIFRLLVHAYKKRRMNLYFCRELDGRCNATQGKADNKNKPVIDLALKSYLAENPSATGINATFKEFVMASTKLFIFVGHDTTSAGALFHLPSPRPTPRHSLHGPCRAWPCIRP
jgi:sterigmatocystin biosynthesis cytochrome P450 monooxygenase